LGIHRCSGGHDHAEKAWRWAWATGCSARAQAPTRARPQPANRPDAKWHARPSLPPFLSAARSPGAHCRAAGQVRNPEPAEPLCGFEDGGGRADVQPHSCERCPPPPPPVPAPSSGARRRRAKEWRDEMPQADRFQFYNLLLFAGSIAAFSFIAQHVGKTQQQFR
jgi:hypothetical protein